MKNKTKSILILVLLVSAMFLISSCGSVDNDESTVVAAGTETIAGEYKIVVEAGQDSIRDNWVLSIYEDKEIDFWYLNIYDNKTNTGIYGPIAEIGKSSITVWHGPDYYTEMPSSSWKTDGDKFKLEYKASSDEIELTNNGATLKFKRM